MPNSGEDSIAKHSSRFYGFVMTYYRNDPYLMLDKFGSQIADIASTVSIDWNDTKSNVTLNGSFVKGRDVSGMELADKGRVSVVGSINTHTWTDKNTGEEFTVKYPSLRFKNFRKHFPDAAVFNGYKALMDEYDSYRGGTRVARVNVDQSRKDQYLKDAAKRREDEAAIKAEALSKDKRWLTKLEKLSRPCPYFESKGIADLFKWVDLYEGETTLGSVVGRFTAIKFIHLPDLSFRGLQRIYPISKQKVFRRGIETSGAAFPVPARSPINGETIYVMEAPADAGMSYKLTGFYSVAALYADNIPLVVNTIRQLCPSSTIVMVADNDQYGSVNKGVDICESTLRNTPGVIHMIIPSFCENGKAEKLKDLTDYVGLYGESEGLKFLSSYSE